MYYAIDSHSFVMTKLTDRAEALRFVRNGVNSSTEVYRMPNGWRAPKLTNPEMVASIIIAQGKAMDVHFKG